MKDTAFVIIHGFGGMPKDIINVKKQLLINGVNELDIFMPLLKGHGTKKGRIELGTTYNEVIKDLENYIKYNCKEYKEIVLVGYSMGGLVALGTAIDLPINKLILLNAPMHIWELNNFIWTMIYSSFSNKKYHAKTILSSFSYNKIRNSIELRKSSKICKKKHIQS